MNQPQPPAPRLSAETVHASTVAIDGRAVLITGPSGSGKSDLPCACSTAASRWSATTRRSSSATATGCSPRRRRTSPASSRSAGIGIVDMDTVTDMPVALIVELTSEIQRLPDDSRERPILGVSLPLISDRRDDRLGAVQGRARARPAGPEVLMDGGGRRPAAPAARHRHVRCGQIDRPRRARGHGLGRRRQPPRRPARRTSSTAAAECRLRPGRGRHGRAQPRLRSRSPARARSARSTGSAPKSSISTAPAPSSSAATTRPGAGIRSRPIARPRTASPANGALTAPLRDGRRQRASTPPTSTPGRAARRASAPLRRRFRPAGPDHRLVRLRARHLAHRRSGVRPALPAQPALGRRASPADRRGPAGARLSRRRSGLGRDDGPHRIASHRLDSPLLGRGQKLRDRCVRMHRGTAPLGGRGSRNGGTVA